MDYLNKFSILGESITIYPDYFNIRSAGMFDKDIEYSKLNSVESNWSGKITVVTYSNQKYYVHLGRYAKECVEIIADKVEESNVR
jgi:hypothetical protein